MGQYNLAAYPVGTMYTARVELGYRYYHEYGCCIPYPFNQPIIREHYWRAAALNYQRDVPNLWVVEHKGEFTEDMIRLVDQTGDDMLWFYPNKPYHLIFLETGQQLPKEEWTMRTARNVYPLGIFIPPPDIAGYSYILHAFLVPMF